MMMARNGQNLTVVLGPRGGCELYAHRDAAGLLTLVLVVDSRTAVNRGLVVLGVNVGMFDVVEMKRSDMARKG